MLRGRRRWVTFLRIPFFSVPAMEKTALPRACTFFPKLAYWRMITFALLTSEFAFEVEAIEADLLSI